MPMNEMSFIDETPFQICNIILTKGNIDLSDERQLNTNATSYRA